MEQTPAPTRVLTVEEAAAMTGKSKTAIQRRIDRGTLRAVVRDGRRRIPVAELRRVGLLGPTATPVSDTGGGAAPRGGAATPPGAGSPFTGADTGVITGDGLAVLLDRLERQAVELAALRALPAQVDLERRTREAAEAELHQVRAELRTAEARLEEFTRSQAPQPVAAPADVPQERLEQAQRPRAPWWRRLLRPESATTGSTAPSESEGVV